MLYSAALWRKETGPAQIAVCRNVLLKAREKQPESKNKVQEPSESQPVPEKKQ